MCNIPHTSEPCTTYTQGLLYQCWKNENNLPHCALWYRQSLAFFVRDVMLRYISFNYLPHVTTITNVLLFLFYWYMYIRRDAFFWMIEMELIKFLDKFSSTWYCKILFILFKIVCYFWNLLCYNLDISKHVGRRYVVYNKFILSYFNKISAESLFYLNTTSNSHAPIYSDI